jgi:hypothetical protein
MTADGFLFFLIDVEFVIQILKNAAKLASEAEARRREAWAGAQRGQLAFPRPRDAWGGAGGGGGAARRAGAAGRPPPPPPPPPRYGSF